MSMNTIDSDLDALRRTKLPHGLIRQRSRHADRCPGSYGLDEHGLPFG